MRALPPVVQARRDSNPQPPVLETGALPVELRTPAHTPGHPPAGEPVDGQGRNRTADTAIFSRVLYQLSYLAKKTPEPFRCGRLGRESAGGYRRVPLPRPRGLDHVSDGNQRSARARPDLWKAHGRRISVASGMISASVSCVVALRQTVLLRGKRRHSAALSSSGGGIRTRDLRVMSPTSYQTAPPRNKKRKVKQSREACQAEVGRKRRASTGPSAALCQARILTPPRWPEGGPEAAPNGDPTPPAPPDRPRFRRQVGDRAPGP